MNAPARLWKNILADRDPQLAIVYVLVMSSMALLGGGKLSLDASLFLRRPEAQIQKGKK